MADLITRLLLNTQQFDQNIGKSSKQIQGFQQKVQTFSSGAISSFTKFAGGIGLAISAGEALNKMMRSNQTTSDLFDNNVNAAKDSVDAFFRSITTGDWTAFNDGLIGAYRQAYQLSTMLDELADKKLSLSYIKAEDLKDIERFEQIAKDTNKTLEDRVSAAQNMAGVVNHLNKATAEVKNLQMEALNKSYASKSGLKINEDDVKSFVSNTNFSGDLTSKASEAYKEYIELQKEANKLFKASVYDRNTYGSDPERKVQREAKLARQKLDAYKQENEFLIKQGWLAEEGDEARQKTVATLVEQLNIERDIYSLQKRSDETGRAVNGGAVSAKPSKVDKVAVEGSITKLDKQLSEWQGKFNNAATYEARVAADKMIKELTSKKIHLEVEVKYGKAGDLKELVNKQTIGKLPVKGKTVKDDIENGSLKIKPIKSEAIEANYAYADSLNAIGSIMGSVTNITNEGAAAWISWGTNILTAIATAIPQIMALTVAKKSEATANSEAAVTGGMSSVASIPVVGWLLALSAGAAIIAAMASIPKFADGGIFTGNSFIGDNMLARVNSGEMILNNRQQRNLFNLLDGKGGTSSLNGANVEFKIKGKELVGVLNAQANKTSKYK